MVCYSIRLQRHQSKVEGTWPKKGEVGWRGWTARRASGNTIKKTIWQGSCINKISFFPYLIAPCFCTSNCSRGVSVSVEDLLNRCWGSTSCARDLHEHYFYGRHARAALSPSLLCGYRENYIIRRFVLSLTMTEWAECVLGMGNAEVSHRIMVG